VTGFFGVIDEDIDHHGRSGRIARIRQIAFYLCRKHTTQSLPEIGRAFHRDHTTISHGVRRIGALRKTDAALHSELSQLEARLADVLAHRRGLISSGT
jgi:chromosomal replication initiator protein